MGQSLLKKHLQFQNYYEIFYYELKNMNLDVFIQCQYTITLLIKKNMGQSLIKKHSKFLHFNKIFYCGMTRPRKENLNCCGFCRYLETIKPKKVVR